MENCIFCKIANGEIPSIKIWENENFFAFLDSHPIKFGHTLLIPKKHIDYVFDLNDDEYTELMLNVKEVAKQLKTKLNSKKIGLIIEGFVVPHAHIHLVPINGLSELNPEVRLDVKTKELNEIAKIILG